MCATGSHKCQTPQFSCAHSAAAEGGLQLYPYHNMLVWLLFALRQEAAGCIFNLFPALFGRIRLLHCL